MENKSVNNIITISLSGRIDSENAEQIEDEILTKVYESKATSIILNMANLVYISSAGLRVILRLKKAYQDVCLINVNSEVLEILEMTGFIDMVTIKKE